MCTVMKTEVKAAYTHHNDVNACAYTSATTLRPTRLSAPKATSER